MKLSELRTEQPLRDADFAAIRARVLSKIAEREQRRWLPLLWWVGAAAMVVVAVLLFPRREVTLPVNPPPQVVSSGEAGFSPPDVLGGLKPAAPQEPRESSPPVRVARRRPVKKPPVERVSRIEIHTADPSVRIIWIVKEKS